MRAGLSQSNILVVGGAGFIGSHLADRLLASGVQSLVIIDNLFLGKRENIVSACNAGAIFYEDDAEDIAVLESIIEEYSIDVVFNLATKALNYSFVDPCDAFETNVTVIGNLLELQRIGRFETLCHFSSSEVYGTALYEPMDEQHPYNPTTTYAGGKAAADIMLRTYVNMFDVDAFIVRPFNNYGPRQNHMPPYAAVIPLTISKIKQGLPPEIHGTGKQRRDFIYVDDTVDATLKVFPLIDRGKEVNISAESTTSMEDTIYAICALTGYSGEILRKPARRADVECHNATSALLKSLIPFKPTSFKEGLKRTVEWYSENL